MYSTCQQNHVPSPVQPWKVPTTNYYQLLFPPQSFHIVDLQAGLSMRKPTSAVGIPCRKVLHPSTPDAKDKDNS